MHPATTTPELEERQCHQNQQQRKGNRRRIAHFIGAEGRFIDIHRNGARRISRSALGQDIGNVKDLKCANAGDRDAEEGGRRDEGERNIARQLPVQ